MLTYVVKTLDKEKINYWIDRSGLLSILRKEKFSLISDIDIVSILQVKIEFLIYLNLKIYN